MASDRRKTACTSCASTVPDSAAFCPRCGASQSAGMVPLSSLDLPLGEGGASRDDDFSQQAPRHGTAWLIGAGLALVGLLALSGRGNSSSHAAATTTSTTSVSDASSSTTTTFEEAPSLEAEELHFRSRLDRHRGNRFVTEPQGVRRLARQRPFEHDVGRDFHAGANRADRSFLGLF